MPNQRAPGIKKIALLLPQEQLLEIENVAHVRGLSRLDIIREAVEAHLKPKKADHVLNVLQAENGSNPGMHIAPNKKRKQKGKAHQRESLTEDKSS